MINDATVVSDHRQTTGCWGVTLLHMLDATDFEACYAAVHSRDRRFDGRFVTGVLTTGIYCRPSCPARTPNRENVRFFRSAAAAQGSGLRACRRCRPELAPDAPGSNPTADLASRALRLIDDGVGEAGVVALAAGVHVSPRHLQRLLVQTYGAGPAALLRMRRVRLARMLVDQTDLPLTRVAHAAGFGSIRQFNEAFKAAFHTTPSAARRGRHGAEVADGPAARAIVAAETPASTASITLPVRCPLDAEGILTWAALHAVPSRDEISADGWTRHTDYGTVVLRPTTGGLAVDVNLLEEGVDLARAVGLARQTFDLDADVDAIETDLGTDDLLAPLVAARPGVRIPGAADPFEGAVRVVVGQQVSARGATTLMARLADLHDGPGLPAAGWIAEAPLEALVGLTRQRAGAVRALAGAVAGGLDLSPAAAPGDVVAHLLDLPGIGPWTANCVALLVLRHPDGWPTGDLALRRAVAGMTGTDPSPRELDRLAERWRPWRGYAALHLWHHHLDPR